MAHYHGDEREIINTVVATTYRSCNRYDPNTAAIALSCVFHLAVDEYHC